MRKLTKLITMINVRSGTAHFKYLYAISLPTTAHTDWEYQEIQSSSFFSLVHIRLQNQVCWIILYQFWFFFSSSQKGGISCAFNTSCHLLITSTGLLWEHFSSQSAGSLLFAFCSPGEATSHFLTESCGNPCSLHLSVRQSQVSRNSPIMLIIWIQYWNVLAYGDNHA